MTSKTTDIAGLDFDAWLGQASKPEREVTLYANNRVQADIDRLLKERDTAEQNAGESWAGPAVDVAAIDKQIVELRKQIAKSAMVFRVRALDSDDDDRIRRAHPMPKDPAPEAFNDIMAERSLEQMACQVFEPRTFTVDELRKVRKGIGEIEFLKLYQACTDTSSEVSASSPFWRGNSGSNRSS